MSAIVVSKLLELIEQSHLNLLPHDVLMKGLINLSDEELQNISNEAAAIILEEDSFLAEEFISWGIISFGNDGIYFDIWGYEFYTLRDTEEIFEFLKTMISEHLILGSLDIEGMPMSDVVLCPFGEIPVLDINSFLTFEGGPDITFVSLSDYEANVDDINLSTDDSSFEIPVLDGIVGGEVVNLSSIPEPDFVKGILYLPKGGCIEASSLMTDVTPENMMHVHLLIGGDDYELGIPDTDLSLKEMAGWELLSINQLQSVDELKGAELSTSSQEVVN